MTYYLLKNPDFFGHAKTSTLIHVIRNGKPLCGRKASKIVRVGHIAPTVNKHGSKGVCWECLQKTRPQKIGPDDKDFPAWDMDKMDKAELIDIFHFVRNKLSETRGKNSVQEHTIEKMEKEVADQKKEIAELTQNHLNEMNALKARMFDKYVDDEKDDEKDDEDEEPCPMQHFCGWGRWANRREECRKEEKKGHEA